MGLNQGSRGQGRDSEVDLSPIGTALQNPALKRIAFTTYQVLQIRILLFFSSWRAQTTHTLLKICSTDNVVVRHYPPTRSSAFFEAPILRSLNGPRLHTIPKNWPYITFHHSVSELKYQIIICKKFRKLLKGRPGLSNSDVKFWHWIAFVIYKTSQVFEIINLFYVFFVNNT